MILIENITVENIPVLHVAQKEKYNEKLPFIIFVHGFESTKEKNLHYAYLLAEKGFRVVLPEAIHHGQRSTGLSEKEINLHFWDIVLNTIYELEILKNDFDNKQLIDTEKIGLAGTSMGGIVTLGALTQFSWIKSAVCLMGMPYYEQFSQFQLKQFKNSGMNIPFNDKEVESVLEKVRKYDLSIQTEKLAGRPLLFWHGEKDEVVPYSYTYHFYESIRPLYADAPEKLQFISDKKAGHKVSHEGVVNLVSWFQKYLPQSNMMEITSSLKG